MLMSQSLALFCAPSDLVTDKSYADRRCKPLEFEVGDKVILKVLSWKGVIRFGKRGKLNPRYIRPFKILAKVGMLAYLLKLPKQLSRVYSTFHVSNLKKCFIDEPLAVPLDEIQIDDNLNFIEEPVEIMDRKVKRLKHSRIPIVKSRKDNGENIMKSIKEGPFQMGTVSDVITGGTEGAVQQGPVRARVLNDLSAEEKERESAQLYDEFEHVRQIKGKAFKDTTLGYEAINDHEKHQEDHVQDAANSKFVNNSCLSGVEFITEVKLNKDKMLLMQAQENGAVLDEEQSLFLAGEQVTNVDDEVDDSTENDLALNVDHVFEADECDAFDSDVDEGPTSQTMFMASLTSEDPIYDEAGPSYDSNNPLEYVEDNEEHVVQCNASSVRNGALMSILDEMHEQGVQSRLTNKPDMLMNDSVTSELARYKELVGEYEKRAKFELTDRERKIDEQMRIIISDRNRKETSLKSELHSDNTP
ncbi:hypothetical protein Tco_0447811 [Tanacetum coccineum]